MNVRLHPQAYAVRAELARRSAASHRNLELPSGAALVCDLAGDFTAVLMVGQCRLTL